MLLSGRQIRRDPAARLITQFLITHPRCQNLWGQRDVKLDKKMGNPTKYLCPSERIFRDSSNLRSTAPRCSGTCERDLELRTRITRYEEYPTSTAHKSQFSLFVEKQKNLHPDLGHFSDKFTPVNICIHLWDICIHQASLFTLPRTYLHSKTLMHLRAHT